MRPSIDTHDYDTKMKAARRFLDEGDKVKMTLRFRGREMAHQELGLQLLFRVRDDLTEMAKVEAEPKLEGRQMIMILAPAVKSAVRAQAAAALRSGRRATSRPPLVPAGAGPPLLCASLEIAGPIELGSGRADRRILCSRSSVG